MTAIKKAEQATQRAKEEALAEEGIAKAQYNALLVLSSAQGIASAELARRCFVTPQAMNETVARLERQGWITRTPHPEHRHVLEARLTASGESVLKVADWRVINVERRILGALSPSGRNKLKRMLALVETAARQR